MPEEKKSPVLKAYAPFEFRGKSYKEGEVFTPDTDLTADANMEEFRRVGSKQMKSKGKVFYYSIPATKTDAEPEIRRVVLPVE